MHMQKKVERLLHPKLQENLWKHKFEQGYVLREKNVLREVEVSNYIGALNIWNGFEYMAMLESHWLLKDTITLKDDISVYFLINRIRSSI